jgi:hypothetical protein
MPPTRRGVKGSELTWAEGDANLDAIDRLTPVVLTISGGSITINGPGVYLVETEGGAGTDDLTAITGGLGHQWEVTLCLNTDGRVITVRHTLPNLRLQNGADFILNSLNDTIKLMDRTSAIWRETGRSSVP